MNKTLPNAHGLTPFGVLYVATFLVSFHLFLVVYINSSFLSTFENIDEKIVGYLYMFGSALGVLSLFTIDKFLRNFGNYTFLFSLTIFHIFAFFGFAFLKNITVILPLFIAYLVTYPLILYSLDIFIESYTENENATGSIRGTLLTVTNTALILGPLTAGFILTNGAFWKVYVIAALFLLPFLFLMRRFRYFKDPKYHPLKIKKTLTCVVGHKDISNILMAQFIMRFFFAWAVIYMPIYLIKEIGFTFAEFGIMTFIYLIPFALLEYPAGRLADSRFGEKEILSLGFFIAAVFTAFISFIQTDNFLLWVAVLFMIRVGLSLIEIMTESYFFKHVDGSDNNTISFFRMTRPFAYIVGPLIANMALLIFDFRFIWLILSFVLLFGLYFSSRLHDTK